MKRFISLEKLVFIGMAAAGLCAAVSIPPAPLGPPGWMGRALAAGYSSGQGQGVANLTPEQIEKVHSRLFRKGPTGEITNMLSRTTGDVHVPCVVPVWQRIKVPFVDELGMLASRSDLIVLAKAEAGTTHMNADRDFLYTDWNFVVEEVLKDNPKASVQPGATILVTRPGGKLQINGRMVHAACADFEDFSSRQEYLLYLGFVPETGAYASGGSAAFAISPPKRLDSFHYRESEASDKDALLKAAKEGVALSRTIPHSGGWQ